jgi:hypothetical protein
VDWGERPTAGAVGLACLDYLGDGGGSGYKAKGRTPTY